MADPLKVLPDEVRRQGARLAILEDKVEVLYHRRSSYVPSRSWANLSGRQREVVFFVLLVVGLELATWLTRRGLDAVGTP
jgi:hypothetical protein